MGVGFSKKGGKGGKCGGMGSCEEIRIGATAWE